MEGPLRRCLNLYVVQGISTAIEIDCMAISVCVSTNTGLARKRLTGEPQVRPVASVSRMLLQDGLEEVIHGCVVDLESQEVVEACHKPAVSLGAM